MKADDLTVGMTVAIIKWRKADLVPEGSRAYFNLPQFTGTPLLIKAISLPFVCVTNGVNTVAIDCREFELGKVSLEYAAAMQPAQEPEPQRDKNICPNCGGRLTQRLLAPGTGTWLYVCSQCGLEGVPIPVGR